MMIRKCSRCGLIDDVMPPNNEYFGKNHENAFIINQATPTV